MSATSISSLRTGLCALACAFCVATTTTHAHAQIDLLADESELVEAVRAGNLDDARARLVAGDSANSRSRDRLPALVIAVALGDHAMTKLLLDNGAWTSVATPKGQTPLTEAAFRGHADIVNTLLNPGANPNQRGPSRQTPLMLAVRAGRANVVAALLKHGADPNVRDLTGRSLADIARRARRSDIEQLIRNALSQQNSQPPPQARPRKRPPPRSNANSRSEPPAPRPAPPTSPEVWSP